MFSRRSDLPLDEDSHSRFLPWLIAFMVFLAVLAMAAVLVLGATAERWDTGVSGTLTVQLAPTDDPARDDGNLKQVLTVLAATPGIGRYEALGKDRLLKLLEPWLGTGPEAGDLPLPRLVDVRLQPGATVDVPELQRRLRARVPGANVDDHRVWLERLLRLIRTVELVSAVILGFIALATVGTVVFTTRTGLAVHREAIEVLHLIGAHDSYVAAQFAGRALVLGLQGSCIGLALGIPALAVLGYLAKSLGTAVLPELAFGVVHWAAVLLLPLAVAGLAMITARLTVLRTLAAMP